MIHEGLPAPLAPPHYVCLMCMRTRSAAPGRCARCDLDRLSVHEEEVAAELRDAAERRLAKRSYREYFWTSAAAFALLCPLVLYVGLLYWLAASVALGAGLVALYPSLFRRSALAVFRDRRRRIGVELAGGRPVDDPLVVDPARLALPELCAWLGARELS